jgi:hypothetical protein
LPIEAAPVLFAGAAFFAINFTTDFYDRTKELLGL